jgi:hypothetical protein
VGESGPCRGALRLAGPELDAPGEIGIALFRLCSLPATIKECAGESDNPNAWLAMAPRNRFYLRPGGITFPRNRTCDHDLLLPAISDSEYAKSAALASPRKAPTDLQHFSAHSGPPHGVNALRRIRAVTGIEVAA